MKRKNLIKLYNTLSECDLKGNKFTYIITKNKRILEEELKDMEEFVKPSDEFKEVKEKIEALKLKHVNKDDNGDPIIIEKTIAGNKVEVYDIPNSKDENSDFNKEFKTLQEENKDLIDEQRKKEQDYVNIFLEEEVDIDLAKLKIEDIPENISQNIMDGIFDIIEIN